MKKFTALLLATTLLCGCGSTENESVSEPEPTTEPQVFVDEETEKLYTSLEEFKNSMFCDNLREMDITIYDVVYDEERYDMKSIRADAMFYDYCLYDNVENQFISFSVTYDPTISDMNDLQTTFYGDRNFITTATNSAGSHEVYLLTPSFMEEVDYGLTYVLSEKYVVAIYAEGNNTSSDEILSYFDDFELVAEE